LRAVRLRPLKPAVKLSRGSAGCKMGGCRRRDHDRHAGSATV